MVVRPGTKWNSRHFPDSYPRMNRPALRAICSFAFLISLPGCGWLQSFSPSSTPSPDFEMTQQVAQTATAAARSAKIKACSLLTREEASILLGEPTREGKETEDDNDKILHSDCIYAAVAAPSTRRVIVLLDQVQTTEDSRALFNYRQLRGNLQPVDGLGDGAFVEKAAGTLYVLKGNNNVALTVIGKAIDLQDLRRSAEMVLTRLP